MKLGQRHLQAAEDTPERARGLGGLGPAAWRGWPIAWRPVGVAGLAPLAPLWQMPDEPMLYEYAPLAAELRRPPRGDERSPTAEAHLPAALGRAGLWGDDPRLYFAPAGAAARRRRPPCCSTAGPTQGRPPGPLPAAPACAAGAHPLRGRRRPDPGAGGRPWLAGWLALWSPFAAAALRVAVHYH